MKSNQVQRVYLRPLFALLSVLLLMGCQEKDLYVSDHDKPLNLENFFDFSTEQSVTFTLSYEVAADYQVPFEVYAQDPFVMGPLGNYIKNSNSLPILTGKTEKGGRFAMPLQVSAALEKLYVYSPCIIVPPLLEGVIVNGQVAVSSSDQSVATNKVSRASTSGSYYDQWSTQTIVLNKGLGDWDTNGKPNYLLANDMELSAEFMQALEVLLPAADNMDATTFHYSTLTLKEKANVDLYFISHGTENQRHNALAYYTFTGNHPTQSDINKNLTIIYPDLASSSLKGGNGVRLKYRNGNTLTDEFPTGSTIGWVLLVDAYKSGKLVSPCNALYSWKDFNSYHFTGKNATYYASRPHMGAFKTTAGDVVLSFEDLPWGTGKPANFRDEVFVLHTNPITAIPDDVIDPSEPATKTMNTQGIYAFEDCWPNRGDYDLNDVMVSYLSTLFYDNSNNVRSLEYTFSFFNDGALYQNAFGFQINDLIKKSNIASCVISGGNDFTGKGLDTEIDVATFMVFEDMKKAKDHKVTLKINLTSPIPLMEFVYNQSCNPFIVVKGLNEQNRTEVHLRKFKPTSKANSSLFNTGSDKSVINKGLYYASNDNYPFAIDIVTDNKFVIPTEKSSIEMTYPKFTDWAKSQGKNNKDWFKYPVK